MKKQSDLASLKFSVGARIAQVPVRDINGLNI
jgi:hypothetical protein